LLNQTVLSDYCQLHFTRWCSTIL